MQIDNNSQPRTEPPSPPAAGTALPGRRPISARKLEANRRNALKSTGPRTPEGKARVAQNARKSTGPVTFRGKARSSGNATRHGVWSGRTVPAEQRSAFLTRLRDNRSYFQLTTPIENLWGILYTYTQWLLSQLYQRRCDLLNASPDLTPISGAMMFTSAEMRLDRRLMTLLKWRIAGLKFEQLFGASYAPAALVSAGVGERLVEWVKRTSPTTTAGSNRTEPTDGAMVLQGQEVARFAEGQFAPKNTLEQSKANGRGVA